jgi:hypothetical protein
MAEKKNDKNTNHYIQNIIQENKDWATQTLLETGGEHTLPEYLTSPPFLVVKVLVDPLLYPLW